MKTVWGAAWSFEIVEVVVAICLQSCFFMFCSFQKFLKVENGFRR